jgi:hypothetical protein
MENKSYPEILHNICVEFGNGEKSRIASFEKAITHLIDQMLTDEKKKLLQNWDRSKHENIKNENPKDENIKSEHIKNETTKSDHYLKNENIKSDCESCSRNDIIVGCTLKRKNQCLVNDKYTKYRRGYLLPCDRCKTYSVITKIDMIAHNNSNNIPRPSIKFMCLKCKEHPMINKGIFKGYELRGVEFTEKYLHICKQKEQHADSVSVVQKTDNAPAIQQTEHTMAIQQTEHVMTVQQSDQAQLTKQEETEIESVAI